MSGKLLNALMELFALIANIESIGKKGRDVVRVFLKQQLNLDDVDEYLGHFDHYYQKHGGDTSEGEAKPTPVSHSVKALVICGQINTELTQKQKVIILIRLLEFIHADKEITELEFDFVSTVASAFNIEDEEFNLIQRFVLKDDPYEVQSGKVLVIDGKQSVKNRITKHLKVANLQGELAFLHVSSADMYAVRYRGRDELFLNTQPLPIDQITPFVNGSTIRGTRTESVYYSDVISQFLSDRTTSRITFTARNITYRFKGGAVGLRNVNIVEESGRLVGIMGASGAGKTTLLNVLCGIAEPTEGEVKINDLNLYKEREQLEGVIGYVPQDDTLIEELTVYQNLYYNAKLCMDHLSNNEIDEVVIQVLNNIGLIEAKDLKVGNPLNKKISGGQRKRLNIGLELIREPSILFVDEPTSGLSSRDSENIMDLLKELTLKGKLVYVVIHQPSSEIYKMFDRMFILDTGGYPVFYGNPIDAIIYFREQSNYIDSAKSECHECGNVNPEQIFNILESKVVDEYGRFTDKRKVSPGQWYELYQENFKIPTYDHDQEDPPKSLNIPPLWRQLKVFVTRDMLSKLSNLQYMIINFSEAPILAFVLAYLVRYYSVDEGAAVQTGYIFSDNSNIVPFIFMSVVVALFLGLTVSAEEIFKDRKILKRESFLNLSRSSYLVSKVTILFIISAIQAFTYVILSNLILGIQDMTFAYWMVFFTTSCFANLLGLNISSAFNSAVTIYILIPILLIPQLLLSGAIVKFDKLNPRLSSVKEVPITGELMTSKWAFEALLVTQFKNNEYKKPFYAFDRLISESDFRINYLLPKLRAKAQFCAHNLNTTHTQTQQRMSNDLRILKQEVKKELEATKNVAQFSALEQLNMRDFDAEVAALLSTYLEKVRNYYVKLYNKVSNKRDERVREVIAKLGNREAFIALKRNYHNKELETIVRNQRDEDRIIEHEGELIQKIDPVYQTPDNSTSVLGIRAHLFAPYKYLFGQLVDTFWVNILMIWMMTMVLYIMLYYDLLKRFIQVTANLFSLE